MPVTCHTPVVTYRNMLRCDSDKMPFCGLACLQPDVSNYARRNCVTWAYAWLRSLHSFLSELKTDDRTKQLIRRWLRLLKVQLTTWSHNYSAATAATSHQLDPYRIN